MHARKGYYGDDWLALTTTLLVANEHSKHERLLSVDKVEQEEERVVRPLCCLSLMNWRSCCVTRAAWADEKPG